MNYLQGHYPWILLEANCVIKVSITYSRFTRLLAALIVFTVAYYFYLFHLAEVFQRSQHVQLYCFFGWLECIRVILWVLFPLFTVSDQMAFKSNERTSKGHHMHLRDFFPVIETISHRSNCFSKCVDSLWQFKRLSNVFL